ncbi:MAG: urease accessory protein UreD [Chromatiaceae bacterium]|nr:urease accessory protein UreD [Chromatiaceae bacterium]
MHQISGAWLGKLDLDLDVRAGRTVLVRQRHIGPLRVQRAFYPEGSACHLYLLHPPGGVVGGDRLEIALDVASGARVLATTPGASKFYRSPGALAISQQRLKVAGGGQLEWFPQENILFPGARLRSETAIELAGDARFIGWEIHSLGRPVIRERFDTGTADFLFNLHREGEPLLRERLRVREGEGLDGPTGLRGLPIVATFIATGASSRDLDAARQSLPDENELLIGLTLMDDLLVARCLAPAVESAHQTFRLLWGILRPRLMGRDACPPRIWST